MVKYCGGCGQQDRRIQKINAAQSIHLNAF
jgi:hypothetical protein